MVGCCCVVLRRTRSFRALLRDRRDARAPARLAAARHHGQLGHLHLRRQHRPRRGDVARLLHQPAGHRAAGRVHPRRAAAAAAVGRARRRRGRRASCSPSTTAGRPGSRWSWPFTFGIYGLVKKQARRRRGREPRRRDRCCSRRWRCAYLGWLMAQRPVDVRRRGPGHALLLLPAGLVTAVPLLCFGAAAIRVPLTTLGLLQYLAPVLQFLLGVVWFHEAMPAGRWIGFALVWLALSMFTVRVGEVPAATAEAGRGGRRGLTPCGHADLRLIRRRGAGLSGARRGAPAARHSRRTGP